MSDLRKLLFFAREKNYVDVTRLSPQKKASPKALPKVPKVKIKKIIKPKKLAQKISPPRKAVEKSKPKEKPKPILKASKAAKIQGEPKLPKEILVGEVTHFFDKIQVCVIKVKSLVKISDTLRFASKAGDFIQRVDSMQINHQQVMQAKKGDEIGLKVIREEWPGDKVFMA